MCFCAWWSVTIVVFFFFFVAVMSSQISKHTNFVGFAQQQEHNCFPDTVREEFSVSCWTDYFAIITRLNISALLWVETLLLFLLLWNCSSLQSFLSLRAVWSLESKRFVVWKMFREHACQLFSAPPLPIWAVPVATPYQPLCVPSDLLLWSQAQCHTHSAHYCIDFPRSVF